MGDARSGGVVADSARDELVADAVATKLDRDRWRRHAMELQRRLDGDGGVVDAHDVLLWRLWHDRAVAATARAEGLGTALAMADRAVRALVADPAMAKADTARAVLAFKRAMGEVAR